MISIMGPKPYSNNKGPYISCMLSYDGAVAAV